MTQSLLFGFSMNWGSKSVETLITKNINGLFFLFIRLFFCGRAVYATTASNPDESSYACYYDNKRQTYLGDVYSVNWLEDSDVVFQRTNLLCYCILYSLFFVVSFSNGYLCIRILTINLYIVIYLVSLISGKYERWEPVDSVPDRQEGNQHFSRDGIWRCGECWMLYIILILWLLQFADIKQKQHCKWLFSFLDSFAKKQIQ